MIFVTTMSRLQQLMFQTDRNSTQILKKMDTRRSFCACNEITLQQRILG